MSGMLQKAEKLSMKWNTSILYTVSADEKSVYTHTTDVAAGEIFCICNYQKCRTFVLHVKAL